MTNQRYPTPEAFKQALEQRLRTTVTTGALFARKRQLLVFDRFLARVVAVFGDAVTLKGGLVLELRLERARTTKDVDLRMIGSPEGVLGRLQQACRRDLGDFMTFEVALDDDHPEIQNDAMRYQGRRFRVLGKLAGKVYGQPFGVDIGFGNRSWASPRSLSPTTCCRLLGSCRPLCASTPSRPTWPRSCTPTPCRATGPTRGSRTCPTSRCWRWCSPWMHAGCVPGSSRRSRFARPTRCQWPYQCRLNLGACPIRRWRAKMSCRGVRSTT